MLRFVAAVIPDPLSIGHRSQLEAAHVKIPRANDEYRDGTLIWLMADMLH